MTMILVSMLCNFLCVTGMLNRTLLYNSFVRTFPIRDSSIIMTDNSALVQSAVREIHKLGVPDNITLFRSQSDEFLIDIMMLAALGNMANATKEDIHAIAIIVADPATGRLERLDSITHNRILILEVMIFVLVIALGRSWFVLHEKTNDLKIA